MLIIIPKEYTVCLLTFIPELFNESTSESTVIQGTRLLGRNIEIKLHIIETEDFNFLSRV